MTLKNRIRNIFKNSKKNLDAIIVNNYSESNINKNFFYVTGLTKGLFENSSAILYPEGSLNIIVPKLEEESAKKSKSNLQVYINKKSYSKLIKESLVKIKNIGLDYDHMTYNNFLFFTNMLPEKKLYDISICLEKARLVKDNIELKKIIESCNIADKVMNKIPEIVYKNMFEFELSAEIDYLMKKNGADKPAFDSISSFGKNTAEPHYTHGKNKLNEGDLILCDFGACFEKYNSDITRTFVFGKANKKQKSIHNIVSQAQNIGFNKIKSSIKGKEIHNSVSNFINNTEYKDRFIHSTGHSIGLAVHDGNVGLNSECEVQLQENMVFTVEPGIYIPGYGGIRIEDDILVKRDNVKLLTKSSRDLIEI